MSAIFLLITAFFAIGYMGFIRAIWGIMQPGALIDKVTSGKWNAWLDKRYLILNYEGRAGQDFWVKVLGGCEQCTSFWWCAPYLVLYFFGIQSIIGWHINAIGSYFWISLMWMVFSLCGLVSLKSMTRQTNNNGL